MEKRYVVSYRIGRRWYYRMKDSVWFTAEMAPLSIASLICWHGYRTKQGAKKAYERECSHPHEEKTNAVELLEFEIDNEERTMSYKVIAGCEFESVYD